MVLIDEARDGLSALDPSCGQRDDIGVVEGRELVPALVRPMSIEVPRVVVEDLLGMAPIKYQEPVGAFFADRAHEPLGVRVAVGAPRRDLGHGDVLAGEDGVESCGEFRVPVTDLVGEVASTLAELPYELSGLLCGPDGGGVGGDTQDMHRAGAYLHNEQNVQPPQADGVDVEEIGSKQAMGLGLEEGGPFAAHRMPPRGWAEASGTQGPADAGLTDAVSQATEFAVDSPEAVGLEKSSLLVKRHSGTP